MDDIFRFQFPDEKSFISVRIILHRMPLFYWRTYMYSFSFHRTGLGITTKIKNDICRYDVQLLHSINNLLQLHFIKYLKTFFRHLPKGYFKCQVIRDWDWESYLSKLHIMMIEFLLHDLFQDAKS